MKKLQKADYIKMYSFMLKIRRFEERAAQLYGMGKIGGFCLFVYWPRSSCCWYINDN